MGVSEPERRGVYRHRNANGANPMYRHLKAACESCGVSEPERRGAASEPKLYATSCRHTTLCADCGRALARARRHCTMCNTPVTRLIQEYNVRVDTSAEKEKAHPIARFATGLPKFSEERSTENRWTLARMPPKDGS